MKAEKLLQEYFRLKDELEDHTSMFHDDMYYDIQGYWEDIEELNDNDIETLTNQVECFRMILKGIEGISYVYG